MVHLGEVGPIIWDTVMDEMEKKLSDVGFKRKTATPDWRKLAHKRRFEREAFAKYGHFKDFVLHPKVQEMKQYIDDNAHFDKFVIGDPLMSITNSIILLYMVWQRLESSVVLLLAAFLFNLNPVYVSMVVFFMLFIKISKKPKGYVVPKTVSKDSQSHKKKSVKDIQDNLKVSNQYDHILLGSDIGTLFTAAILAKCGHRCIVLQPDFGPTQQV
jgi:hypothetical protein